MAEEYIFKSVGGILQRLLVQYIRGPNHPGKIRICRKLLRVLFPDGIALGADNGAKLVVNGDDFIGWAILVHGCYEPASLQLASRLLANGGAFIDVGANFGLYTAFLGVHSDVVVVSVEPDALNFTFLMRTVKLNHLNNVSLANLALSSSAAFLEIEEVDKYNRGKVRVKSELENGAAGVLIHSVRLNDLLDELGMGQVRLLKIDVEGYELPVLRGLDFEGEHRPQNILLEFSDYGKRIGDGGKSELLGFLDERGYVAMTIAGEPLAGEDDPIEANAWFADSRIFNQTGALV